MYIGDKDGEKLCGELPKELEESKMYTITCPDIIGDFVRIYTGREGYLDVEGDDITGDFKLAFAKVEV